MRSRRNDELGSDIIGPLASSEAGKPASDQPGEGFATSLAKSGGGKPEHVPERTCVLTRVAGPRERLLRLALGPDGTVHPDVRAKAGGRGAWLAAGRPELEKALIKGRLQGQLRRAFRADTVTISPDLPERAETALRQAALDRLGMEAKAGNLLTGSERIDAAARSGQLHLLLHASDASADGTGKLAQAWRVGGGERQGLVLPADRTILSMALGRENVVHIAVGERAAAARIRLAVERWLGFSNGTGLLPGGDASPGEEGHERLV